MKKFFALTLSFILLSFSLVTIGVHAQADPIPIDEEPDTTLLDEEPEEEVPAEETKAGAPDTGIAPSENRLVASSLVFIGGAALGGALGFGFVQYKRKSQQ